MEPMAYDCVTACIDEIGYLCCDQMVGSCARYVPPPEE